MLRPPLHLSTYGMAVGLALATSACSGAGSPATPGAQLGQNASSTSSTLAAPAGTALESMRRVPGPGFGPHVLVVANSNIADSETLAATYMQGRRIPSENLLNLPLTNNPDYFTISEKNVEPEIFLPVAGAIKKLATQGTRIDYVVMMYGTPYYINNTAPKGPLLGYSVDGLISQAMGAFPTSSRSNPYSNAMTPFTSSAYHMVLVTRLDGRTPADVAGLIALGLASDHTFPSGEYFFDIDPSRYRDGYASFNDDMTSAQSELATAGFDAQIAQKFIAPAAALSGYTSWGSNDAHFSLPAYDSLHFVTGAIAETAVSTSASNLRGTPGARQSQIADLIHQGVTGVHGDVTEPELYAIPHPQHVFASYTSGRTLAEAFYSGMSKIVWKEIVIGDPLAQPYRK